jgi:hypothetical protein
LEHVPFLKNAQAVLNRVSPYFVLVDSGWVTVSWSIALNGRELVFIFASVCLLHSGIANRVPREECDQKYNELDWLGEGGRFFGALESVGGGVPQWYAW